MTDKFNGFSQDEINQVSREKRFSAITTTTTKAPLKQAFRGQHTGIRRVPEKWSKLTTQQLQAKKLPNNQKPPLTISTNFSSSPSLKENEIKSDRSGSNMANIKRQVSNNNNNNNNYKSENNNHGNKKVNDELNPGELLDDFNFDASLSKSLENVLFYNQRKVPESETEIDTNSNITKASNCNSDTTDSGNDSSILKIPNGDLNATSSDESTILTNLKANVLIESNKTNGLTEGGPTTTKASNNAITSAYTLNTDSPFKGISLKEFENHRKMIQEQNKQKKDLLYKAIELHSKKTAEESKKIEEIKSELVKLDSDLAVDVAILRKQIDAACVHFSNIEKQYMKIEAQFLKAKLDLHNAAERKELLTEHLCTVIAHNEDRKAQKLSELMEKVGLAENDEAFNGVPN